jgi:hypothetical protein
LMYAAFAGEFGRYRRRFDRDLRSGDANH